MTINGENIKNILRKAVNQEVSDVYIRENRSISFKDSKGTIILKEISTLDDIKEILKYIIDDSDKFTEGLEKANNGGRFLFGTTIKDVDSGDIKNIGLRVRCQLVKDNEGLFLTIRLFLNKYIDYFALTEHSNIGEKLDNIFKIKQGLIIIIGGTGQGKSTLVSAYLEKIISQNVYKFLKTIEDPIEHIFHEKKIDRASRGTIISQTEIGKHIKTYEEAILACTRDNSDIVYIQEIASKESAIALKKIMNSGKLVVITLHASKVTQAISRLLVLMREFDGDDVFNKKLLAQESICIIGQTLITGNILDKNGNKIMGKDGSYIQKKYGIQELLNIGPTERNFIIDEEKGNDFERSLTKSLYDPSKGNVALNNVLINFYKKGIIEAETLIARTNDIINLKAIVDEQFKDLEKMSDFKYIDDFISDKRRPR